MQSAFGVEHVHKMVVRAPSKPQTARGKLRKVKTNAQLAAVRTGQVVASNDLKMAALLPRLHG